MDNPKVAVRTTSAYGQKGLFATERICSGEKIASFDGRITSWDPCSQKTWRENESCRTYSIQFHPFMCRDSTGFARYSNHSCNPNCGIKDLFNIVAMRDIHEGEEITWDYAMSENDDWAMVCSCDEKICRGVIRGYRFLPRDRRVAYTGFLSEWHFDPYVGETGLRLEKQGSRYATNSSS